MRAHLQRSRRGTKYPLALRDTENVARRGFNTGSRGLLVNLFILCFPGPPRRTYCRLPSESGTRSARRCFVRCFSPSYGQDDVIVRHGGEQQHERITASPSGPVRVSKNPLAVSLHHPRIFFFALSATNKAQPRRQS